MHKHAVLILALVLAGGFFSAPTVVAVDDTTTGDENTATQETDAAGNPVRPERQRPYALPPFRGRTSPPATTSSGGSDAAPATGYQRRPFFAPGMRTNPSGANADGSAVQPAGSDASPGAYPRGPFFPSRARANQNGVNADGSDTSDGTNPRLGTRESLFRSRTRPYANRSAGVDAPTGTGTMTDGSAVQPGRTSILDRMRRYRNATPEQREEVKENRQERQDDRQTQRQERRATWQESTPQERRDILRTQYAGDDGQVTTKEILQGLGGSIQHRTNALQRRTTRASSLAERLSNRAQQATEAGREDAATRLENRADRWGTRSTNLSDRLQQRSTNLEERRNSLLERWKARRAERAKQENQSDEEESGTTTEEEEKEEETDDDAANY